MQEGISPLSAKLVRLNQMGRRRGKERVVFYPHESWRPTTVLAWGKARRSGPRLLGRGGDLAGGGW